MYQPNSWNKINLPDSATLTLSHILEIMAEEAKITIPAKLVEGNVSCAVCLSVINKTWTVKECLHRFCNLPSVTS